MIAPTRHASERASPRRNGHIGLRLVVAVLIVGCAVYVLVLLSPPRLMFHESADTRLLRMEWSDNAANCYYIDLHLNIVVLMLSTGTPCLSRDDDMGYYESTLQVGTRRELTVTNTPNRLYVVSASGATLVFTVDENFSTRAWRSYPPSSKGDGATETLVDVVMTHLNPTQREYVRLLATAHFREIEATQREPETQSSGAHLTAP